jgi:hypothetical protein
MGLNMGNEERIGRGRVSVCVCGYVLPSPQISSFGVHSLRKERERERKKEAVQNGAHSK